MIRNGWVLVALAGAVSCGSTEPAGPESGVIVASLNTPNDRDGALVIRIIGEQSELRAAGSYRMATANAVQGTTMRVILSGQIADGAVLEFTVPDISKLGTYAVTVEQAAARGSYALLDPSGYTISLRVK